MENIDAAQRQAQAIEAGDMVSKSGLRLEVPRILEHLKKISELKIDNFTQLSGAKFESTVKEMFAIIKDLEGHLRDVLTLNAALRDEVRETGKEKGRLLKEKDTAVNRLAVIERDIPRALDLEKRLEIVIEEVEKFRALYKQEKEMLEKSEAANRMIAALANKAREERDDAYREIVVMGDKLKSVTRANP